MKWRTNLWRNTLVILAALLLAAVPVSAGPGKGVYQFTGHLTDMPYYSPGTETALPGGRILQTGEEQVLCYAADEYEPGYDFFSGCYFIRSNNIIEPSGAMKTWGVAWSTSLTSRPGGGWTGEFAGVWTPGAKVISLHSKYEGTGDLEGWSMTWREFAQNYFTGPDPYEVDKGHFAPPR